MDEAEAAFFARRGRRCCCFPWPSSASSHQRVGGAEEESWWQRAVDAVLKVREWSELVAGPRWKTFIRRFGRGGGGRRRRAAAAQLRPEAQLRPAQLRAQFRRGPRRRVQPGGRLRRLPRLLHPLRRPAGLRQVVHGPRRPRRPAALQPAAAPRRRRPGLTSRSSPPQSLHRIKREHGVLSSICFGLQCRDLVRSEIDRCFGSVPLSSSVSFN